MNRKSLILALYALFLSGTGSMAFDTCIYIDRFGDVLRLTPMLTSAEFAASDGSTLACIIDPALGLQAVSTGSCRDAPGVKFAVFTGASNPSSSEDDVLIFRNDIWYKRCAFTR